MSEVTLNAALRRLGYGPDQMTPHGFRSAASSMLNESGLWHADAIERQLAHVDADSVRRAYARADFWEERVRMMAWWADRLDEWRGAGAAR
jgi:integrase